MNANYNILAFGLPSGTEFLGIGILAVVAVFVATAIFQVLWNWTIPELFRLSPIRFWQAFRLLLLSSILFGGVFRYNKPSSPAIYVGQPPYEVKR